jgi:glycosyltransferase involved in cell wall biosynthesis
MAAGKAVIGSSVDGIPYYVEHGKNGLIFESENVEDLAVTMRTLLASPRLCDTFGKNGRAAAMSKYSEAAFGRQLLAMLETVLAEFPPREAGWKHPAIEATSPAPSNGVDPRQQTRNS